MGNPLVIGLLVVLAILIIGSVAVWRGSQIQTFPDGAPVPVQCSDGSSLVVLWATYGSKNGSCPKRNVTRKVQGIVDSLRPSATKPRDTDSTSFVVSPTTLGIVDGCNSVRELTIRYWCPKKSAQMPSRQKFTPVPELTCGPDPSPEYAIDVTGRGAVGTVIWEPFSTAPCCADMFTPVPELTCGPDPAPEYAVDVTGRGAVGTVIWEPFISSTKPTDMNVSPSQSLLAKMVRRSPLTGRPSPTCQEVLTDVDSDLDSEGISDSSILCTTAIPKARSVPAEKLMLGSLMTEKNAKELTKRLETTYRNPHIIRTPSLLRMGLGSLYKDPRFQPGPEDRGPGDGGYAPAPGTDAGGPALSALTTYEFMPGGPWDSIMVKGFGWQRGPDSSIGPIPVEAAITNSD